MSSCCPRDPSLTPPPQIILLIEDSGKFYSSFLPALYSEVWKHATALEADSQQSHRENMMRRYARPKARLHPFPAPAPPSPPLCSPSVASPPLSSPPAPLPPSLVSPLLPPYFSPALPTCCHVPGDAVHKLRGGSGHLLALCRQRARRDLRLRIPQGELFTLCTILVTSPTLPFTSTSLT